MLAPAAFDHLGLMRLEVSTLDNLCITSVACNKKLHISFARSTCFLSLFLLIKVNAMRREYLFTISCPLEYNKAAMLPNPIAYRFTPCFDCDCNNGCM
jgi:hypothetical protein